MLEVLSENRNDALKLNRNTVKPTLVDLVYVANLVMSTVFSSPDQFPIKHAIFSPVNSPMDNWQTPLSRVQNRLKVYNLGAHIYFSRKFIAIDAVTI